MTHAATIAVVLGLLAFSAPAAAQKAKPAAKVYDVPKDGLVVDGKMTKNDPPLAGAPVAELNGVPHQVFQVKLVQGQNYVIDLGSKDFDTYLILQNTLGKVLAHDDDSGGGLNSRIVVVAKTEGTHHLVVAALDRKPGAFQLKVRAGVVTEGEKLAEQASLLNNEARVDWREGRFPEAITKLRRALAIREQLYSVAKFPEGHPDLAESLNNLAVLLLSNGQTEEALPYCRQSLDMCRKLYPAEKYPDGNPDLAARLSNLGAVLHELGLSEQGLPYCQESLAMYRKLHSPAKAPAGHPDLAAYLINVGAVLNHMGRAEQALPLYRESLDMYRKLYPASSHPDGHPHLAICLKGVGAVLQEMGQLEKALTYYQESLEMTQRVYPPSKFPSGHPDLAGCLHQTAYVLAVMGQPAKALPLYQRSLDMNRKLYPKSHFPAGHPDLAVNLNNIGSALYLMGRQDEALAFYLQSLGMRRNFYPASKYPNGHTLLADDSANMGALYNAIGQPDKAMEYYRHSVDMYRKLYPEATYPDGIANLAFALVNQGLALESMGQGESAIASMSQGLDMSRKLWPELKYPDGHDRLAHALYCLGFVSHSLGRTKQALAFHQQNLAMRQRLLRRELAMASEEAAFDTIESQPPFRDAYLSLTYTLKTPDDVVYQMLWPLRSMVTRLLEQRQANARAAGTELGAQLDRLRGLRRRTEQLLQDARLRPADRDRLLATVSDARDRLEREVVEKMPALKKWQEHDQLGPKDLSSALPPGAVFIDILRYTHLEYANQALTRTPRYVGFVVDARQTPARADQAIRRIELADAATIDDAVSQWRAAIDKRAASPAASKLHNLIWPKIAAQLPPGTKTLFIAADGDLARVPWAALPLPRAALGDVDRVLLDDYAIAQTPHGTFLLDRLRQPRSAGKTEMLLTLGGLEYGTTAWPALPGTVAEINVIAALGPRDMTTASGQDATPARVLDLLPRARFAHLATHGEFKADELTQEKKRADTAAATRRLGEQGFLADTRRIAAKNPLGYVGLVLSDGAVVSGLAIVDLPLEKLQLVTLSACEAGLGEYTAGEGVQGLQRAFHIAGCPNVVASLWKVNDAATAALMAKFYHEMWGNKKPPLEALREAQLTIYRHPELIPDLAGERGVPRLKEAVAVRAGAPTTGTGKHADTKLWAAFVLSGVGR